VLWWPWRAALPAEAAHTLVRLLDARASRLCMFVAVSLGMPGDSDGQPGQTAAAFAFAPGRASCVLEKSAEVASLTCGWMCATRNPACACRVHYPVKHCVMADNDCTSWCWNGHLAVTMRQVLHGAQPVAVAGDRHTADGPGHHLADLRAPLRLLLVRPHAWAALRWGAPFYR